MERAKKDEGDDEPDGSGPGEKQNHCGRTMIALPVHRRGNPLPCHLPDPEPHARGGRQRGLPPEMVFHRPGVSPPPPLTLPSKRWRDLILRVWHVDPLRCPVCQSPMRVIAVIDDPNVAEKILLHLATTTGARD